MNKPSQLSDKTAPKIKKQPSRTHGDAGGSPKSAPELRNKRPPHHPLDEESQEQFVPGIKPVLELLEEQPKKIDAVFIRKSRHGSQLDQILDICRCRKIRFSLLPPGAFSRVYPGSSQGVIARLAVSPFQEPEELFHKTSLAPLPLLVALDQVQDPGNAGTLARTLYAMGGAGLLVPRHNGVYLGAAAAKAAAGALEKLPVAKVSNLGTALDQAKKHGLTVYGTAACPEADAPVLDRYPPPKAAFTPDGCNAFTLQPQFPALLVLGNEEKGLRPAILKRCDALISIPMARTFDSLNVAQAGAILIAQFYRTYFAAIE